MTEIEAIGVVDEPVEAVFAFLSTLENHWTLAGRWIEVVALAPDAQGGRVRIRGPLGLRRTVTIRVEATDPPVSMRGMARLGATRAEVSWTLSPRGTDATEVRLAAAVVRAGPLDRALLALGGRRWMRRLFAATLARLPATLAARAPSAGAPALSSGRA
ncbi:MAG: SRPBCC family protein [Actinomycetota bacterium]|nr:SRPBCC family protein [Actinomycetota bacterium]